MGKMPENHIETARMRIVSETVNGSTAGLRIRTHSSIERCVDMSGASRYCGAAGSHHDAAKHSAMHAIRMFIMHSVFHMW